MENLLDDSIRREIISVPLENPKAKVYVSIIPRDVPGPGFLQSIFSLMHTCSEALQHEIGIYYAPIMDSLPGFYAVGMSMYDFMQTDCTHYFCSADDFLRPRNTISRLVEDDKDIICPPYRTRDPKKITSALTLGPEEDKKFFVHLREGTLIKVPHIGGHDFMVKRHVIEKMVKDYPELSCTRGDSGQHFYFLMFPFLKDNWVKMDDFAFSERAIASGFECWIDMGLHPLHNTHMFLGFPEE